MNDLVETRRAPRVFSMPNLVALCETVRGVRTKIQRKWVHIAHLSGSLQVIGIWNDMDRSVTDDFLSVIHVVM